MSLGLWDFVFKTFVTVYEQDSFVTYTHMANIAWSDCHGFKIFQMVSFASFLHFQLLLFEIDVISNQQFLSFVVVWNYESQLYKKK